MSAAPSLPDISRFRHPAVASIDAMMRLDGQSIGVTGGASGIGLAVVEAVLALGARATIIDLSEEAVEREVARLSGVGHDVDGHVVDICDGAATRAALQAAAAHTGALDGVVASAGTRMKSQPLLDLDDADWQRIMDINLTGVFLTCKAAAHVMVPQQRGSIVTIASLSGHAARLNQSAYCVSKAGVVQLSRVLALELASANIRVNSVCPGTTVTAMFDKALEQDGDRIARDRVEGNLGGFRAGIPLRRLSDAIDQAAAAVYLLTDLSRHVTGQSMLVDGGESVV